MNDDELNILRRNMLLKHLERLALCKNENDYNNIFKHDFTKVHNEVFNHSSKIIKIKGMPHCICKCNHVCELKEDGSGMIIHNPIIIMND